MLLRGDINESVLDFIHSKLSPDSVQQFLSDLFFDAYELLYAPADAMHILLVHSNSEYPFTPNDLVWLGYAPEVLVYKKPEGEESVFCFNIECSFEDYYLICAAIIKVFNRAFPGVNIFVFKIFDAVALGSARDFYSEYNDFAITGLFTERSLIYEDDEGFFEMIRYSDISDIPDIIISCSPQEKESLFKEKELLNSDYLSFLSEFQSLYGIDTSQERQRCLNEIGQPVSINTHAITKKELEGVADGETVSSYQVLDAAEEAEEKSKTVQFSTENISERKSDVELKYSQEAFKNAEQMLKEMLDNSK